MIFVTGCTGFIGSRVCELLLEYKHQVIGIDNLDDAYDVRLKEWRLSRLRANPAFTFHRVDITDRKALQEVFRMDPPEAVINLAARAGVRQSIYNPWVYFDTNLTGTLNALELCREFGVGKFVLASTSSVYGKALSPFREDTSTALPLSPYAASKKAAEVLCYTYHHLYKLDVTVFRYFTVYGPAGRPDMSIFRFVKWAIEEQELVFYGDGSQERDFTFVDDVARGTVLGLKPLGYSIINLGNDRPIALNDVAGMLEEIVGRRVQVFHGPPNSADVPTTRADISKAQSLLGWEPKTGFNEGLKQTVQWYLQNRTWAREIELGDVDR